jgi:GNAT superfamily N-acetyltransferase
MTQAILTDPTDAELAVAVQENLYALFRSMQALPGCEVLESDRISYHHASPTNPMFKGVWRTRLPSEEVEAAIDEAQTWFEQRGAPYFFWWTDSQTQPADLAERLMKRGFDGNLEGNPGMALELHSLDENMEMPEGFAIVHAVDDKALDDWRNVFAVAFESPVSAGQAWVDATLQAGLENVPWKLYVGYLDGKPVAVSLLFNGAGVAGVYAVGTLPEARRKGIGAAITLKPLLDARAQGYHFAVLFSSRMGYTVYQRLGFREVPGSIGMYIMEMD